MFIQNTTYVVPNADARNFVIWVHEAVLACAQTSADVNGGRLARILSHKEEDSECFSVQLEAATTAALHRWHVAHGQRLSTELHSLFEGRIIGFSTLMEVIDGQ